MLVYISAGTLYAQMLKDWKAK